MVHEPILDDDAELPEDDGSDENPPDAPSVASDCQRQPPIEGNGRNGGLTQQPGLPPGQRQLRPFCFLLRSMRVQFNLDAEKYAFKDDGRPTWALNVAPASTSDSGAFGQLMQVLDGVARLVLPPSQQQQAVNSGPVQPQRKTQQVWSYCPAMVWGG